MITRMILVSVPKEKAAEAERHVETGMCSANDQATGLLE